MEEYDRARGIVAFAWIILCGLVGAAVCIFQAVT